MFSFVSGLLRVLYEWMLNLSDVFSVSIEITVWFFP